MQEIYEFRLPQDEADQYLPNHSGARLRTGVCKLRLGPEDPLFAEVERVHREFRARGEVFFYFWNCFRKYSRSELSDAKLLKVEFRSAFEPTGEECGTHYDESTACPECGAGATQTSELFLDGRRIPPMRDCARSIAGELVVSHRFVSFFRDGNFSGAEFEPVRLANRGGEPSDKWFQILIKSSPVDLHDNTRVGDNPFAEGAEAKYRCSRGDLVGLRLLSEVSIQKQTYFGDDIVRTRQFVGRRGGVLRPEPIVLISNRLWSAFEQAKLKRWNFEVGHLA